MPMSSEVGERLSEYANNQRLNRTAPVVFSPVFGDLAIEGVGLYNEEFMILGTFTEANTRRRPYLYAMNLSNLSNGVEYRGLSVNTYGYTFVSLPNELRDLIQDTLIACLLCGQEYELQQLSNQRICLNCRTIPCSSCGSPDVSREHFQRGCSHCFGQCLYCMRETPITQTCSCSALVCYYCLPDHHHCEICAREAGFKLFSGRQYSSSLLVGGELILSWRCTNHMFGYSHCYGCDSYLSTTSLGSACEECGYPTCIVCDQDHSCADTDSNDEEEQPSYHNRNRIIHTYDYIPPKFIFHSTKKDHNNNRYFGIELEIDGGGESSSNAKEILQWSDGESLYYIKHDGSLNDGLEVVSMPATVKYHLKEFPWQHIVETASALDYKSHTAGTCGLHIHIDKSVFSSQSYLESGYGRTHRRGYLGSYDYQTNVSKLILLFWRHWEHILVFSRRVPGEWQQQYTSWNYDITEERISKRSLQESLGKGKYVAINTSNPNTVEIRIFRGTLRLSTLKATIQFTDVLLDLVLDHGFSWIVKSEWSDILSIVEKTKYVELKNYLKERHILDVDEIDDTVENTVLETV